MPCVSVLRSLFIGIVWHEIAFYFYSFEFSFFFLLVSFICPSVFLCHQPRTLLAVFKCLLQVVGEQLLRASDDILSYFRRPDKSSMSYTHFLRIASSYMTTTSYSWLVYVPLRSSAHMRTGWRLDDFDPCLITCDSFESSQEYFYEFNKTFKNKAKRYFGGWINATKLFHLNLKNEDDRLANFKTILNDNPKKFIQFEGSQSFNNNQKRYRNPTEE